MSLIPVKNIYTTYENSYYNPDDGHDSDVPGENENWAAIQKGFKSVSTDVATLTASITSLTARVEALENNNK